MRTVFLSILFCLISSTALAQGPYAADRVRPPTFKEIASYKEVMKFEVKYGFFKIGWFEIQALKDTLYNGNERYHLQTQFRSNGKIPFITTEIEYFNSLIFEDDKGRPVTDYYWKDDLDEGHYKEIEYIFDRASGEVNYIDNKEVGTLELIEPATAGQLMFIYGRMFAGAPDSLILPVYVSEKLGYVRAENSVEIKRRKVPAFKDRINTYYSEGKAALEGPFGLSGRFKAWYMADNLRVPVETHVKVLLGSVKVKLIEYSRTPL